MSYILDALKKAERERGLTEVPRIETVHDLPLKKKTGVWIVAGGCVLCLLAAGGLFFLSSGRVDSGAPESAAINRGSVPEDSQPLAENRESLAQRSNAQPVAEPEPVAQPAAKDIAPEPPVSKAANVSVAAAPETKPRIEAAKPESPNTPVKAEPRIAVTEPVSSVPDVKTPPPVAAKAAATAQKPPPVYENAGLAAPEAAKPVAVREESPKVSRNVPSLHEIARAMNISVLVYREDPDKRMVFINGKKYKEGDSVEQDCVLEGITPEGVMLKRKEETVFRLVGSM